MSIVLKDINPFSALIFKTKYDGWNFDKVLSKAQELIDGRTESESLEGGDSESSVSNPINPHKCEEIKDF